MDIDEMIAYAESKINDDKSSKSSCDAHISEQQFFEAILPILKEKKEYPFGKRIIIGHVNPMGRVTMAHREYENRNE